MQEGKVYKHFKYRIAKETAQSDFFLSYMDNAFGQTRFVYNHLKEHVDKLLDLGERLPSRFTLYSFINNVLKTKYPWLKGTVDKYYFSHIANYIHDAYIAFLCGRSGRPRFKSKTRPFRSVTTNNSSGSSFKLD